MYLVHLSEKREYFAMKKISKQRVNMQQQLIPLEHDVADPFVAGLYSTFQTEVTFVACIRYCRKHEDSVWKAVCFKMEFIDVSL